MDRLRRAALLTRLVERLREKGSWCGETHLQKATLFLQDLTGVPLGFDFILYKHGPFFFDLRGELTSLRADGLLKLEPQWPYGPRIIPTEHAEYIQKIYKKTLEKYDGNISFVADRLGDKALATLERLATAFYLTRDATGATVDSRTASLTKVKPHINESDARAAVVEVDQMIAEAVS
jgi:hypothetical protein